jgi:hypothetical protein
MIMFEQSRRLSQPLRWGRREKLLVGTLLAAVLLALVALGVYALTRSDTARADCVSVTFASTLGGAELHACGSKARAICASGSFRQIEQQLSASCARAGFAYRPPSR